jgi:hypothetical protein
MKNNEHEPSDVSFNNQAASYLIEDWRFKIDSKRIYSEQFDDETIVLDLSTGIYYSLNFVGTIIWSALVAGNNLLSVIDKISSKVVIERPLIKQHVLAFATQLIESELIEKDDSCAITTEFVFDFSFENITYNIPALQKHDEIKEALLADIVHSIDIDGLPKTIGN